MRPEIRKQKVLELFYWVPPPVPNNQTLLAVAQVKYFLFQEKVCEAKAITRNRYFVTD